MAYKETTLKKEFQEKDLQRLRNLIQGKTGDRTTTLSGYTQKQIIRQEGEIWEEDGRRWLIKAGVKQNISKLQELRKASIFPIFCPECKKKMNERYDKQLYTIYQHCFDCQIQFEKKLKLEGKFEEYQKLVHNSEIDGLIAKYEDWVEDLVNGSNDGFVTEQGDVERWSKTNHTQIIEQKYQVVNTLKELKK